MTLHTSCTCPACCSDKPFSITSMSNNTTVNSMQYGWICPICNTVYAPFVSQCANHSNFLSITTINGVPINTDGTIRVEGEVNATVSK